MVTEQTWQENEFEEPINEQTVSITEFRGSGRARYLTRQRDPADATQVLAGTTTWYDYDRDEIYGDYEVDVTGQTVSTTQIGITETGFGQVDYNGSGVSYFHGDQIGSTRLLTDSPHTIEDSYIYTAFGEKVHADGSIGTRYRYAGAYGYQNDSEFAAPNSAFDAMHVGYRYYSPAIGRFLQRDPIGMNGGINVYAYVLNHPTVSVDPTGLFVHGSIARGFLWITGGRNSWLDNPKTVKKVQKGLVIGAGVCAVGAGGLAVVGFNPWIGTVAIHGAHHTFPVIGKAPHIQIMVRTGRHSTFHLRIPLF